MLIKKITKNKPYVNSPNLEMRLGGYGFNFGNFVMLDRKVFNLSLEAIAIYFHLRVNPGHYKLKFIHINRIFKLGERAYYKALNQLKEAGLVKNLRCAPLDNVKICKYFIPFNFDEIFKDFGKDNSKCTLSAKSFGIYLYMATRPRDFVMRPKEIQKRFGISQSTWQRHTYNLRTMGVLGFEVFKNRYKTRFSRKIIFNHKDIIFNYCKHKKHELISNYLAVENYKKANMNLSFDYLKQYEKISKNFYLINKSLVDKLYNPINTRMNRGIIKNRDCKEYIKTRYTSKFDFFSVTKKAKLLLAYKTTIRQAKKKWEKDFIAGKLLTKKEKEQIKLEKMFSRIEEELVIRKNEIVFFPDYASMYANNNFFKILDHNVYEVEVQLYKEREQNLKDLEQELKIAEQKLKIEENEDMNYMNCYYKEDEHFIDLKKLPEQKVDLAPINLINEAQERRIREQRINKAKEEAMQIIKKTCNLINNKAKLSQPCEAIQDLRITQTPEEEKIDIKNGRLPLRYNGILSMSLSQVEKQFKELFDKKPGKQLFDETLKKTDEIINGLYQNICKKYPFYKIQLKDTKILCGMIAKKCESYTQFLDDILDFDFILLMLKRYSLEIKIMSKRS